MKDLSTPEKADMQHKKPGCRYPARFLRENYPGIILRLDGDQVFFHDPQMRKSLEEYVRTVEPWIVDELRQEQEAQRRR